MQESLTAEFLGETSWPRRFLCAPRRVAAWVRQRLGKTRLGRFESRRMSTQEAEARTGALEEANKKLSLADKSKNEFIATLAHELRNPLAPVVSSLELMRVKLAGLGRPDLTELLDIADTHSNTLTHLLDDLLDISRISRNKFKLRKEVVDLRSVIARAEQSVDGLVKAARHTLSISLPDGTLWIEADPLRLEQIIVNVLSNAAKYTDPGGRIELAVVHDAATGVRIRVKDNGKGIEPHMLSRIFEPFTQVKDGASTGLGIGLSLTKRLADLHGAKIRAESEGLGKGSTFVIELPPQVVQLPLAALKRRRKGAVPGGMLPVRTRSILIVDDNVHAADGLSKLLKHKGHDVAVVYDGPSALSQMRARPADAILLDIGMPEMDGYEVVRRLREEYGRGLLVAALTGYGQDEDKVRAQEAGFNYHLTKPVTAADVEAIFTKSPAATAMI